MDPYTLPTRKLLLPTTLFRLMLARTIKPMIKNEDVLELLTNKAKARTDEIIRVIESANVYDAKVMANLYAASPEGVLNETLRKFESTRSIAPVFLRRIGISGLERSLRRVVNQDIKLQRWRWARYSQAGHVKDIIQDDMTIECPSRAAKELRKKCWGKEIRGITMPPITHQVEYKYPYEGVGFNWDRTHYFLYTSDEP